MTGNSYRVPEYPIEPTSQPFAVGWNPKGYLNNSMHRISVRVS